MPDLLHVLEHWKPFTALVIGDFMLDQLVYGDAERLSPDAPVPVLAVRRTESRAGGAANVCLDLAAMRARVLAMGVTGDDPEAITLRDALAHAGIDSSGLLVDHARPTTVKRSLIGLAQHRHPQKMFRMDLESREALSHAMTKALLARVQDALRSVDVVCLEDYGKGVCAESLCRGVIDLCRAAGKPVLVDPALRDDYSRYAGATAITPNRNEAELAAASLGASPEPPVLTPGADEAGALATIWADIGSRLLREHRFEAVVLTLDRHGAMLVLPDRPPVRLPTVARKVYDVTGAGDMVLAALAAAIANGADWPDAVRFANAAAGLEVEIFGVEPIPLERIHHAVLLDQGRLRGKVRTLPQAVIEAAAHRREGRSIVFTNGVFDLLHAGHIALLRHAARQGDALFVGVNSDDSVRRLKGPDRPVHAERDRAEILSELESVAAVIIFDEDTPMRLIEALRPEVLVKGGEYEPSRVVGGPFVESYGGRVDLAPMLEGRSTTAAIARARGAKPGAAV